MASETSEIRHDDLEGRQHTGDLICVGANADGKVTLRVSTDLLEISHQQASQTLPFSALSGAAVLPRGNTSTLAILPTGKPPLRYVLNTRDARSIANRIIDHTAGKTLFYVAKRFGEAYILRAGGLQLPEQRRASVEVLPTGIQVNALTPSGRRRETATEFIPWDAVLDLAVENPSEVASRPSLNAYRTAQGIDTPGKNRGGSRGFLVVATRTGQLIVELIGTTAEDARLAMRDPLELFSKQHPTPPIPNPQPAPPPWVPPPAPETSNPMNVATRRGISRWLAEWPPKALLAFGTLMLLLGGLMDAAGRDASAESGEPRGFLPMAIVSVLVVLGIVFVIRAIVTWADRQRVPD